MKKYICSAIYLLSISASFNGLCAEASSASPANSESFSIEHVSVEGSWQSNFGFSERVIVNNPGKILYLSGVGSNADDGKYGKVLHEGDIAAQCRRVWTTIMKQLSAEGATVKNITRVRTYVTDPRYLEATGICQNEVLGTEPPFPPHTFIVVVALAIPEMLIEVEVTAALP